MVRGFEDAQQRFRRNRIGRLAMVDAAGPYVVPISFVYADGAIYGHTSPGMKLSLLRRSPQVALLVDEIQQLAVWESVLVRGRWHELTTADEQYRARCLILNAFGSPWWATAGHGHRTTLADATFHRIDIEAVTGRSQNA